MSNEFQIISFYQFKPFDREHLTLLKESLRDLLRSELVFGTIIIAKEGFNASLCGSPAAIGRFVPKCEQMLGTRFEYKSSFHDRSPFLKHEVRIKPEIVTLKKPVEIALGKGTYVSPLEWNSVISDPEVFLLDTRNDYEFRTGRFAGAVNPATAKFSELPQFVELELDPNIHKKIAMYCTGGIRCEKFAPYLKEKGFEKVFQLEGGILKYLEEVPAEDQLWEGECFVFDERVALDEKLKKGTEPDHSQRRKPA